MGLVQSRGGLGAPKGGNLRERVKLGGMDLSAKAIEGVADCVKFQIGKAGHGGNAEASGAVPRGAVF